MNKRFARFSSVYCLKKAVAWILRQKGKLLKRVVGVGSLTVDELSSAQIAIIKAVQWEYFSKEMSLISSPLKGNPMFSGPLQKLNPICVSGILRVGGRMRRSPTKFKFRHHIILPSDSHVTKLLIEKHQRDIGHCGMSFTWTSMHQTLWVIKSAVTVQKILGQCLFCKRRNATAGKQFMADFPSGRVTLLFLFTMHLLYRD